MATQLHTYFSRFILSLVLGMAIIISGCAKVTAPEEDTRPPVVSIISPADGDTVNSDTLTVTVSIQDESVIVKIIFLIDGVSAATMFLTHTGPEGPYDETWPITFHDITSGQHTILVEARDAAGNVGRSLLIQVTHIY